MRAEGEEPRPGPPLRGVDTWTRSSLPLSSPVSVSSSASLALAHFSRSSFSLPNLPSYMVRAWSASSGRRLP